MLASSQASQIEKDNDKIRKVVTTKAINTKKTNIKKHNTLKLSEIFGLVKNIRSAKRSLLLKFL
jgi:hypothetical protein